MDDKREVNKMAAIIEKEQKKVVYSNGYALEMPNREQAREEFSREEIEKIYDQKIAREAKKWGENYIYTKWARESKVKNLEQYDEGKVVAVYSNEYHLDGMDWLTHIIATGQK